MLWVITHLEDHSHPSFNFLADWDVASIFLHNVLLSWCYLFCQVHHDNMMLPPPHVTLGMVLRLASFLLSPPNVTGYDCVHFQTNQPFFILLLEYRPVHYGWWLFVASTSMFTRFTFLLGLMHSFHTEPVYFLSGMVAGHSHTQGNCLRCVSN